MIEIANRLADIAGDIAKAYFRQNIDIALKAGESPVTCADKEIETELRAYIKKVLPNHGIIGEEFQNEDSKSDYTWVIDPIDGTSSFACGKPTFCVLIALLKQNKPILGILDQPMTQERWIGFENKQSTLNGKACYSNSRSDLVNLKLSCTTPEMFINEEEKNQFKKIRKISAIASYGGDGYSYGLLSSGSIDIIFESDLKYYDVAALIPIIEGSGGRITEWDGTPIDIKTFNGTVLACCNQFVHTTIVGNLL